MRVELTPRRPPVTGDVTQLAPSTAQCRAAWPVLLIAMPFVSAMRPSIQIGLLRALAASHGFPAETLHANVELAAMIGLEPYEALSNHRLRAVGDWLFSLAAFPDDAPDRDHRLLADHGDELRFDEVDHDSLVDIREKVVPAYLDRLVELIQPSQRRVVGFTSTFQQNVASFALARRLKAANPGIVTVFGGANFEGVMGQEYVRSVDVIDYAVSGEADLAFTALLDALSRGDDPIGIPGVLTRRDGVVVGTEAAPFERLDELPLPDYDEYFERAATLGIVGPSGRQSVYLPFEASRGCWWGAKAHCTFCGLNGSTMGYRAKRPERVLGEVTELNRRYRSFDFEAVDNILEPAYLDGVFPVLRRHEVDLRFFFEVKANLTRPQLKLLAEAGVRRIQPGIESLSSRVLARMRKGVRSSANVNLLRWCRYYGIEVGWNLLWGFPGETAAEYDEQAALFPLLTHLPPPNGGGRIWMERFSPIFSRSDEFPTKWRRPESSYRYVYPPHVDLDQAAYFFDYEFEERLDDQAYAATKKAIVAWQRAWEDGAPPELIFWNGVGVVQVEDRREEAAPVTHTWYEPLASIYRACSDAPITADRLLARLRLDAPREEVVEVLEEFTRRGVMMRDGNLFLALAVPANRGR